MCSKRVRTYRSKSCIIHGITTPFLKRSTACLPKNYMLKFKFVICVPQQMDPQPPTLAQALNVVLETSREQRKLIWMLTQNTSQEKLVKLSKGCYCCKAYDRPCLQDKEKFPGACYCCRGYDRPCLQDFLAKQTPMSTQDL